MVIVTELPVSAPFGVLLPEPAWVSAVRSPEQVHELTRLTEQLHAVGAPVPPVPLLIDAVTLVRDAVPVMLPLNVTPVRGDARSLNSSYCASETTGKAAASASPPGLSLNADRSISAVRVIGSLVAGVLVP